MADGQAFGAFFAPPPQPVNPPQGPGQAFAAALGQPAAAPADSEFTDALNAVGTKYPRLKPYLSNVSVRRGTTNDDRQLEYYAPWDSDNPNPGKSTVEIYSPDLKGNTLSESIALDMLHHLGGQTPDGKPVDPTYNGLKQQMVAAIKAANQPWDREAYQMDMKQYPDSGSYDQWMQHNRADAYIRALVSPEMNPEWNAPDLYTPDMKRLGAQIVNYLKSGQAAAGQ